MAFCIVLKAFIYSVTAIIVESFLWRPFKSKAGVYITVQNATLSYKLLNNNLAITQRRLPTHPSERPSRSLSTNYFKCADINHGLLTICYCPRHLLVLSLRCGIFNAHTLTNGCVMLSPLPEELNR